MTEAGALDEAECLRRLASASHGVLATVHPKRGVDAVPVVFAVSDRGIALPVDRVKAKRTTDLQRVRNIERDPRCVLLVDHYADDWRELWWVRVHAEAKLLDSDDAEEECRALAARYPAYEAPGAIAAVLLLRPTRVRGWQASGG